MLFFINTVFNTYNYVKGKIDKPIYISKDITDGEEQSLTVEVKMMICSISLLKYMSLFKTRTNHLRVLHIRDKAN